MVNYSSLLLLVVKFRRDDYFLSFKKANAKTLGMAKSPASASPFLGPIASSTGPPMLRKMIESIASIMDSADRTVARTFEGIKCCRCAR